MRWGHTKRTSYHSGLVIAKWRLFPGDVCEVFSLRDVDEEDFDVSSRCFVRCGGRHGPQNRAPLPMCEGRGLAVSGVLLMKAV